MYLYTRYMYMYLYTITCCFDIVCMYVVCLVIMMTIMMGLLLCTCIYCYRICVPLSRLSCFSQDLYEKANSVMNAYIIDLDFS